jgi:uncharacterized protein YjbJ (UPF0337 family)
MDEKRDDDLKKQGFKDSLKGKSDQLKGRIKEGAGEHLGDKDLEREGKIDQFKGKAKDTLGKVERKIDRSSEDDDL